VQCVFQVGDEDRHQVRFRYSRLTNTVRIDVDGDLVERDAFRVWIPGARRYEFEVGRAEHHDVVIDMSIPRDWAKFRNPECHVTIDGRSLTGAAITGTGRDQRR
jgi:hypothetical protein